MMQEGTQTLSGYLLKRGEKGLIKDLKRRFFRQVQAKLYYYKAHTDTQALGHIELDNYRVETPPSSANQWPFNIRTPQRVWQLAAESEQDREYWVNGLRDYLEANQAVMKSLRNDSPNDVVVGSQPRESLSEHLRSLNANPRPTSSILVPSDSRRASSILSSSYNINDNNNSKNNVNNNINNLNGSGLGDSSSNNVDADKQKLQEKLETANEEIIRLRERLYQASEKNVEVQSELKMTERKLHDQVDAFLIERDQIRRELSQAESKQKAAEEKMSHQTTDHARDKLNAEKQHSETQQQLLQSQNALDQSKKLIESLSQELQSVGRSREETTKMISEMETELTQARRELKEKTDILNQLQQQTSSQTGRLSELEKERDIRLATEKQKESEKAILREQLENSQIASVSSKQFLDFQQEMREGQRQKEVELDQLRAQLKSVNEAHETERQILQQQVEMQKQRLIESEYEQLKKDSLLSSFSTSLKAMKSPSEEIKKLQQKVLALQEHNSFMASELERMEAEKAIRVQSVEKLKKQVEDTRAKASTSQKGNQNVELALESQIDWLKKRYFNSIVLNMKLQGHNSNADISLLYEKLDLQQIPLDKWEGWISTAMIKK